MSTTITRMIKMTTSSSTAGTLPTPDATMPLDGGPRQEAPSRSMNHDDDRTRWNHLLTRAELAAARKAEAEAAERDQEYKRRLAARDKHRAEVAAKVAEVSDAPATPMSRKKLSEVRATKPGHG
jgi:hypothetical protein